MTNRTGIPDMRFINRELKVADVAKALDLRFDGNSKIHCWHAERHKNGDRTASVGVRATNNTVKCFGCDSKPMGPIDLVMDVQGLDSPADAAIWVAEHFTVPTIPAKRHLVGRTRRDRVGYERGLGLLIRSGLWAGFKEATQAVAPVLLEFAEPDEQDRDKLRVRISYCTITRFSGVRSPNAIRGALVALGEAGFLTLPNSSGRRTPEKETAVYTLTPNSDALWDLAQAVARQMQQEIAAEVELRKRKRSERIRALKRNESSLKTPAVDGCT